MLAVSRSNEVERLVRKHAVVSSKYTHVDVELRYWYTHVPRMPHRCALRCVRRKRRRRRRPPPRRRWKGRTPRRRRRRRRRRNREEKERRRRRGRSAGL